VFHCHLVYCTYLLIIAFSFLAVHCDCQSRFSVLPANQTGCVRGALSPASANQQPELQRLVCPVAVLDSASCRSANCLGQLQRVRVQLCCYFSQSDHGAQSSEAQVHQPTIGTHATRLPCYHASLGTASFSQPFSQVQVRSLVACLSLLAHFTYSVSKFLRNSVSCQLHNLIAKILAKSHSYIETKTGF
jgi:hypothetical protein